MPAIADLYFDGSATSWQDFMDALLEIKSASELGGVFARVRPPAHCMAEARRVIRDLCLEDCVELLDRQPIAETASNLLATWTREPLRAGQNRDEQNRAGQAQGWREQRGHDQPRPVASPRARLGFLGLLSFRLKPFSDAMIGRTRDRTVR